MPIGAQQSWQNFTPDSPSYYGAQGIGIPPFMQERFGGSGGAGGGEGTGVDQSVQPTGRSALRGGMRAGVGSPNAKPQWFQDFENRQNQMQFLDGTPRPAQNPAQPPAVASPVPPSTAPDMSAQGAPMAQPPGEAPQQGGIGVPPVEDQQSAPAQGAPASAPAVTAPVTPQAPAPSPQGQAYQPGLGSAVQNGWFHDSNPTGGNYAGEQNGQPIYYHYGNQSAEDQYKAQYPGANSGQPSVPTTAPTPTPSPVAQPSAPTDYSTAPNSSTTPEALGGTQSTADWASNQQQAAAGFGSDVPEALGGTKKMARGGAVRSYAQGGEVDMDGHMGLVHAARSLAAQGRGPDTSLAHISPDESAMLDYMQGGRRTNPETGLPEYSLFGDILKAVARVAATTVGFMYGGPLGAAAGSAAATKLTGGSWKDAAISGGLSGLTAGIGNVAGGNALMSSGNSLAGATAASAPGQVTSGVMPGFGGTAAGSSLGQTLAQGVKYLGTAPGLSLAATSGLGAFNHPSAGGPPPGWQGPGTQPPSTYDPKNLPSWYLGGKSGPPKALNAPTEGGAGVEGLDPSDPEYASKLSLAYAGAPTQMAGGGSVGIGAPPQALMNAAEWGYVNAQGGGAIHGPGTGTSDEVPALLSNQEHVVDAQTIGDAGTLVGKPGNHDVGQEVMEKIKQEIRRAAGRKNPRSPTSPLKPGYSEAGLQ